MEHTQQVNDFRLLDLGIITLEWTTSLFVLVVFFVTVYLINELLFKPVIANSEHLKKTLDDNSSVITKNNKNIKELTLEIKDNKEKYWREMRNTQRQMLLAAQNQAEKIVYEKQSSVHNSISIHKQRLDNEIIDLQTGKDIEDAVTTLASSLLRKVT